MRIRLSPRVLVPAAAAALIGLAGGAQAAAGSPPAAPIFYCPKVVASPQACPATGHVTASNASKTRSHGRRVVRAHATRVHVRRNVRLVHVARASNPEDEGTSASQAWSYRYQLSRGGLHPWETDAHHQSAWRGEDRDDGDRYDGRDGDDEDAYADRRDDADQDGADDRGDDGGYEGEGARADQGDRYDSNEDGSDQGEGYKGGGYAAGGYASRSGSSYSRSERVYSSDGGGHASVGEPAYADGDDGDSGGHAYRYAHSEHRSHGAAMIGEPAYADSDDDSDRAGDDRDSGDRYGAESHHRLMYRHHASAGGYVRGEDNGAAYGWSWGDMRGDHHGDRGMSGHGQDGHDGDWLEAQGGHHYIVGGHGGRRGVWYDTDDQAVPYAGRDAAGYLVWPGKTSR